MTTPRAQFRASPRGFTLVEMMVVVAIIGILTGLLISVSAKPYGANPRAVSTQIAGMTSLAKQRAVSSRRWHRVQVTGPGAATPSSVLLWQWSDVGMAIPGGTCTVGPPVSRCWQFVSSITLSKSVILQAATTTVYAAPGASVTPNATLDFDFAFRPDGSSTGGTLFLSDSQSTHPWRVLVYHATGSSYARELW